MRTSLVIAFLLVLTFAGLATADDVKRWGNLVTSRKAYREALDRVRKAHGGSCRLPAVEFFLFGMGPRDKYVYADGKLRNALTGHVVREWEVAEQMIAPAEYTVAFKTRSGKYVFLCEDEEALWLEQDGTKEALTKGAVRLPDFRGHKHRLVLRVLHQELLVNVVNGKPVPNLFVYSTPWYRDGAMMAMAFQKTGNLAVIKDWVLGLRAPYDRNNNNETEADNLGQCLYLVSLVSDKSHPLVPLVQRELPRFTKRKSNLCWVEGRSDFAVHPVYQTKWAKFGLAALGLDDPFTVPRMKDSYAALFWWSNKKDDVADQPLLESDNYPYLTWAASHYAGKTAGKLSDRDYPLTWEAHASQANYDGMRWVAAEYVKAKTCAPHTWHAAEAFLYLREEKE
jgi:hypothetical protein